MRVALRVAAALVAALGNVGVARAADLTFGSGKFLFFSGVDLWRHGTFSHGGALWNPQGLEHEGFVAKFTAGTVEWSAAAGWTGDSDDRTGVYGRLGLLMRGEPR